MEDRCLLAVVTTTADAGPGSLRQAILDANASQGPDTIEFQIPSSDPNFVDAGDGDPEADVFVIRLASELPPLNNPSGVYIDGFSQRQFTGNTNGLGPEVELDGSQLVGRSAGITVLSAQSGVGDLAIHSFPGVGIEVMGSFASVSNNFVGLSPLGQPRGNRLDGIRLSGEGASVSGNQVGDNLGAGIFINSSHSHFIDANAVFDNREDGIAVYGNDSSLASNEVLGNERNGVYIWGHGNIVSGNVIGSGNGEAGVRVDNGLRNVVADNSIFFNGGAGILLFDDNGRHLVAVDIQGNAIYDNALLPIDLSLAEANDGSTPNDAGDVDFGPNELQNAPRISLVETGPTTRIVGTLDSVPLAEFRLEFYDVNGSIHSTDHPIVQTNSLGHASFDVTLNVATSPSQILRGTATRLRDAVLGSITSELSPPPPGRCLGLVFNDLDADGVLEVGEPPLSGWTVYVDSNDNGQLDAGEFSGVTGPGGDFQLSVDVTGTVSIRQVPMTGWRTTFPPSGSYSIDVQPGQVISGLDFGNHQQGTILGVKYSDTNGNGVRDTGELGLPGWTIYADLDQDGLRDSGEPFAVTGSDGSYEFLVDSGTYTVREEQQAGWRATGPLDGVAASVVVSSGLSANVDFGNQPLGTVAGTKWDDRNGDGLRSPGEPPLAGWTIYLDRNQNGALDAGEPAAVTGGDGRYSLEVEAGTHVFREVSQSGWEQTHPDPLVPRLTVVGAGQSVTGVDFGNWRPAAIEGVKWEDSNRNGVQDLGESTLPGWTIRLDLNDDGIFDLSTQTDSQGAYRFSPLAPGTYVVGEELQTGWEQTFPSGSFAPPSTVAGSFSGPSIAQGIAGGDLDGDGDFDLVVTNDISGSLGIFHNNGSGDFTLVTEVLLSDRPQGILADDIDGDGDLDFVVSVISAEPNRPADANRLVLVENILGSYQVTQTVVATGGPLRAALGDVVGDSAPDLVVVETRAQTVKIFENQGDGSFVSSRTLPVGRDPVAVALADLDGNQLTDILVANSGDNNIRLLLNDANGSFQSTQTIATGSKPGSITTADLDKNGTLDILVSNFGSHDLSILMKKAGGYDETRLGGLTGIRSVVVTDLDRDPDATLDLAIALSESRAVAVRLRDAAGNVRIGADVDRGGVGSDLVSTDLDGDGDPDLAATAIDSGFSGVSVMLNTRGVHRVQLQAGETQTANFGNARMGEGERAWLRSDVDGNGFLTPADVLLVVNALNDPRIQGLRQTTSLDVLDVNRDGRITPADALTVIYDINLRASGEGEQSLPSMSLSPSVRTVSPASSAETSRAVDVLAASWGRDDASAGLPWWLTGQPLPAAEHQATCKLRDSAESDAESDSFWAMLD